MAGVLTRERRPTRAANPADFRSSVHRYRDPRFDTTAVKVFPGEHYVTSADEMLVTVLGSCVAACIRDPAVAVGGMNHFMLPEAGTGALASADRSNSDWCDPSFAMRYGNVAMEQLINDILARGGRRQRLEIKVFGAATS